MNPFEAESSIATGFEDSNHKKQAKNPVVSRQRDDIQNALFEPSKIFWKLSSNIYEIIFYPLTFPRCVYEFSAKKHCLKYSKEHMLPFISWAKV